MKPTQLLFVLVLVILFSIPSFSQQQVLLAGSSISKKLLKNESHVYIVTLEKGGYTELVVMQKGVDLAVNVTDPSGKKIGYFDSPNGMESSEPVTISASAKGKYQVHIYPLIDEPQMSDSDKLKWADQNQGAYEINDIKILSARSYQQKLAKEKADNEAAIRWLSENAHPLNFLSAGNGFEDLQWLKSVLQDVRFVGMGTSTAGTREFFQIRHRMLEFLVNEMGFTGFAVSTSYAACKIVNDYVSRGKGDINTVLSSLGFWLNTEEVRDMIEWTRSYNQNKPEDKKIKFVGFDVGNYSRMAGAQQVEDYLKKIDPVLAKAKAGLFKFILEGVDFTMRNADSCKKECNNLLLSMQMSRGNYIQASSEKDYEEAVQYVTVIAQFFDANYMPDSDPRKTQRDWNSYYSVSNFNWLIQQEGPGTKFIVWAHNISLMKDIPGQNFGSTGTFGNYLKKMYGDAYYVMGLFFNKGIFRAKEFVPGKTLDQMQPVEITLDPAKQNSPEWYLAQTKKDKYIINFRNATVPENVNNRFLSKEMNTRMFFPFVVKAQIENSYVPVSIGKCFDGLLFIDNTTAARQIKKE